MLSLFVYSTANHVPGRKTRYRIDGGHFVVYVAKGVGFKNKSGIQ